MNKEAVQSNGGKYGIKSRRFRRKTGEKHSKIKWKKECKEWKSTEQKNSAGTKILMETSLPWKG